MISVSGSVCPVPTRKRIGVIAFACTLSMVTYLDRAAFASAAGDIVKALGLRNVSDLKWSFSAFALAYALFEVPTGWMGDAFGPKKSLYRIVLWWSVFTALTAAAGLKIGPVMLGLGFLVAVRFLFGAGEAGAYPNITRVLHNWLPLTERGSGQGLVWFCGKLVGGLTPFLWTLLVVGTPLTSSVISWRGAFCSFGILGIFWCILFRVSFTDRPQEHPGVNAAELAMIQGGVRADLAQRHKGVPWGKIIGSRSFQFTCLMYAAQAYGWWFYITYLPQFMEQHYHAPSGNLLSALYKGGPLWAGAFGTLIGGFLTDFIVRRTGNLRLARRFCGMLGHSLCALSFLVCPLAPNAFVFFAVISFGAFLTDLAVPSAWATCQDIGGRYAAVVGAFMNMTAGCAGAVAGWATGSILDSSVASRAAELGVAVGALTVGQTEAALLRGFHINFYLFAALYVVAFLCWFKIDPTRPIEEPS